MRYFSVSAGSGCCLAPAPLSGHRERVSDLSELFFSEGNKSNNSRGHQRGESPGAVGQGKTGGTACEWLLAAPEQPLLLLLRGRVTQQSLHLLRGFN